jgi:hypothetical protein
MTNPAHRSKDHGVLCGPQPSSFQIALILLELRPRDGSWIAGCSAYVTSMADYYSIIANAVSALDWNTEDARQRLYERARAALIAEMRGADPALNQSDILVARISLEEAIGKVEAEARRDRGAHRSIATPERGEAPPDYSSGETDSARGRGNWMSDVLARASRDDYGLDDDQDLTPPRELGPNR